MKKILVQGLIGLLLSVTVVGSNWHSHPLNQPETPDCPAYIISIVVNSQIPVLAFNISGPNFENSVILQSPPLAHYSRAALKVVSNKSPPFI